MFHGVGEGGWSNLLLQHIERSVFLPMPLSFLIIFRLIDFAFLVLELLMFKVFGVTRISKIEFFNFSGTEKVKPCFSDC